MSLNVIVAFGEYFFFLWGKEFGLVCETERKGERERKNERAREMVRHHCLLLPFLCTSIHCHQTDRLVN